MKKKLWILSFIMAMVFMMAGTNLASAYTITSSTLNSSAVIESGETYGDPPNEVTPTPGMWSWQVGSTDQLFLQWFWFRTGIGTTEDPYVTTMLGQGSPTSINSVASSNELDITYDYNGLIFETFYAIEGSGDYSHIDEDIKITNSTGSAINDFVFYEYNDFDLQGTIGGDIAVAAGFEDAYAVIQTEGSTYLSEVSRSVAPADGDYEIGEYNALYNKVIGGGDLSNTPALNTPTAFNDLTWAFSWTIDLGVGDNLVITKDKVLVTPIPTTLLLFGSGLFSLLGVGIRRRRVK